MVLAPGMGGVLFHEAVGHPLEADIVDKEASVYRGRVGSGLAGRKGTAVLEQLRGLEADASPFVDAVPRVDAAGTTWLRPEVVVPRPPPSTGLARLLGPLLARAGRARLARPGGDFPSRRTIATHIQVLHSLG